jgi:hypothetical protein
MFGYGIDWIGVSRTAVITKVPATYDANAPFDATNINPAWIVPGFNFAEHTLEPSWVGGPESDLSTSGMELIADYAMRNLRAVKEGDRYFIEGKMPIIPAASGTVYEGMWDFGFRDGTGFQLGARTVVSQRMYMDDPAMQRTRGFYSSDGAFRIEVPESLLVYDRFEFRLDMSLRNVNNGFAEIKNFHVVFYAYTETGMLFGGLRSDGSVYHVTTDTDRLQKDVPGGASAVLRWR